MSLHWLLLNKENQMPCKTIKLEQNTPPPKQERLLDYCIIEATKKTLIYITNNTIKEIRLLLESL